MFWVIVNVNVVPWVEAYCSWCFNFPIIQQNQPAPCVNSPRSPLLYIDNESDVTASCLCLPILCWEGNERQTRNDIIVCLNARETFQCRIGLVLVMDNSTVIVLGATNSGHTSLSKGCVIAFVRPIPQRNVSSLSARTTNLSKYACIDWFRPTKSGSNFIDWTKNHYALMSKMYS